jgi:putative proteasome-type protease
MTYCVAITTNSGLVLCSDSRTNAGPDMISTHSKMHVFKPLNDRVFFVLVAGNLATTQAIISHLKEDLENIDTVNLANCSKMLEAAKYVSGVARDEIEQAHTDTLAAGVDTSCSIIFGGQIIGVKPAIFMIYSAGNFVQPSEESPFLQIGENKYGKPILDRFITKETSLEDAARCALVSMDSTIKSNATVGPPIELLVYEKGTFSTDHYMKLEESDPYLLDIRNAWNETLKTSFANLPLFHWEKVNDQNIDMFQNYEFNNSKGQF